MTDYIKTKSSTETFSQKGLDGFRFPLSNKDVEIYYVDVKSGHDNFIISKKITHVYYILEGTGVFEINGQQIRVKLETLVEVPPNIEYTYSGAMKLLLIMNPPWYKGNETITKKNPSV